jgi:hypothetical protein
MRIRYFLILAILLFISVPSCASPATSNQTATTPDSPGSNSTQTTLSVGWLSDGVISTGEYSDTRNYGDYTISWRSDDLYLYCGMTARTSGWIAIAFQPGLRMKNADMVFGLVKDGKAEVQDLFSTGDFGPHKTDTELGGTNDILSYGGKEDGTKTTIEFKRLLVTKDNYDIPVTRGINKILWAFGDSDNPDLKHASKGYGEINIK